MLVEQRTLGTVRRPSRLWSSNPKCSTRFVCVTSRRGLNGTAVADGDGLEVPVASAFEELASLSSYDRPPRVECLQTFRLPACTDRVELRIIRASKPGALHPGP